jgi:hypothetical protein
MQTYRGLLALILLVMFIMPGLAQSFNFSLSQNGGTIMPGAPVTMTVTFTDSSPVSAGIVGLQWSTLLSGFTLTGPPTLGAATSAAFKTVTCGADATTCIAASDGGFITLTMANGGGIQLLAAGAPGALNRNVIGSGIIATIPLRAATGPITALSVSAPTVMATNAAGIAVPIQNLSLPVSLQVVLR